ncbi:MAG: AmmeMemoRadiSam system protein A [Acidobacteriota bacterium]|jgi:AmmeMemoRadiSam system protein A
MTPGPEERADALPRSQRTALLELARRALERHLEGLSAPSPPDDPLLQRAGGVFVSLHRGEDLAGCIGYIESEDPLPRTVIGAAIAAGTRDPRFPPVTPEDLAAIRIEISILSPLRPLNDPASIEVGRDGLLIEGGGRRGLLLPQVAASQGWDPETFLRAVCDKAGLPSDAWRQGAALYRFTAQVFSEPAGQGPEGR